jgi:polysaccharide export outer membrane protein
MDDFEWDHAVAVTGRLILALAVSGLAACSNVLLSPSLAFVETPKNAAQTPPEPPVPEGARISVGEFEEGDNADTGELRLQPGDAVKVSLWGYPELDHLAVVQPNGNITVPLVGETTAAERTVAELRTKLQQELQPFTRISTPDLRPGDILTFMVWREDGLRHASVIDPNGYATFPMVGAVKAAGRPVEEVRLESERRLAEYLRDAKVSILPAYNNRRVLQDLTVSVLAHQVQPRRIAVIGEVGVMGMTDLKPGGRIIDVLAQAQIRQSTAAINSVVVIRNPPVGKPRYRVVRLEDFLEGRAPLENIALRNGDIVIVPQTPIAQVGEFVELFFTRTMPVFMWWGVAWESSVSRQKTETVRLINESLTRNLNAVTITPNR